MNRVGILLPSEDVSSSRLYVIKVLSSILTSRLAGRLLANLDSSGNGQFNTVRMYRLHKSVSILMNLLLAENVHHSS